MEYDDDGDNAQQLLGTVFLVPPRESAANQLNCQRCVTSSQAARLLAECTESARSPLLLCCLGFCCCSFLGANHNIALSSSFHTQFGWHAPPPVRTQKKVSERANEEEATVCENHGKDSVRSVGVKIQQVAFHSSRIISMPFLRLSLSHISTSMRCQSVNELSRSGMERNGISSRYLSSLRVRGNRRFIIIIMSDKRCCMANWRFHPRHQKRDG